MDVWQFVFSSSWLQIDKGMIAMLKINYVFITEH